MSSATPHYRGQPERSVTWPPPLQIATQDLPASHKGASGSISAPLQSNSSHDLFSDALDVDPGEHFLSEIEMYEYEDWANDSDEEIDEIEWDAGITDFALFNDDRERAQESNEPLPGRWKDMLDEQASALQRAVERNRESSSPDPVNRPLLSSEDLPSLTPDNSPSLRDDLDIDSYYGQVAERPSIPNYLTITITPPNGDEAYEADEDEEQPLSFSVPRKQPKRKVERPGLRYSRTMSGRVHAWSRPGWNMYTVGEDADAEERAETCTIRRVSSSGEEDRGRCRSQR